MQVIFCLYAGTWSVSVARDYLTEMYSNHQVVKIVIIEL